jgi:hypothetical protein
MSFLALSSRAIAESPHAGSPCETLVAQCLSLSKELLDRMQLDQKVRMKLLQAAQEKHMDLDAFASAFPESPFLLEVNHTDAGNRKWLAAVVDRYGWPGRSVVGKDAAHAAWLLIQHDSQDIAFQKNCLSLMLKARKGEVASVDIAYLMDRIRVNEGKKQRYGTQLEFQDNGSRVVLKPVENPERLDDLRREVGLQPIAEYLQMATQVLGGGDRNDLPETSAMSK